ncbi:MAG: hypothetical protein OXO51_11190 [Gemmatimonadota bacterium]|nr:hypothetical protein [Gemmatimonadota bacterium]
MATTNIKSTYTLDVESARALEALSQHWNISKSEVLRRVIELAVREESPGRRTTVSALDRLQASLRERKVDVTRWAHELKDERRAATRKMPYKSK